MAHYIMNVKDVKAICNNANCNRSISGYIMANDNPDDIRCPDCKSTVKITQITDRVVPSHA